MSADANCLPRLSFFGLLIYASVVFHQFKRGKLTGGGSYQPTANPGSHNLAHDTSYPSYGNVHDVHNAGPGYSNPAMHKSPQQPYYEGQQPQYPGVHSAPHAGEAHEMGRYN